MSTVEATRSIEARIYIYINKHQACTALCVKHLVAVNLDSNDFGTHSCAVVTIVRCYTKNTA